MYITNSGIHVLTK